MFIDECYLLSCKYYYFSNIEHVHNKLVATQGWISCRGLNQVSVQSIDGSYKVVCRPRWWCLAHGDLVMMRYHRYPGVKKQNSIRGVWELHCNYDNKMLVQEFSILPQGSDLLSTRNYGYWLCQTHTKKGKGDGEHVSPGCQTAVLSSLSFWTISCWFTVCKT